MSLKGLNVLVTRPAGQAAQLMAFINESGGKAIHFPVLAINALDATADQLYIQSGRQLIMALDNFHHVIFISTNAVRFGMEWIDDFWPQLPQGITWHAIGESTAKQLKASGTSLVCDFHSMGSTLAMNSESLLLHPDLQQINGHKILIVRGVGGREHLKEQLVERGANVQYLECYRRALSDKTHEELLDQLKTPVDVICINSGDSLENLCQLASSQHMHLLNNTAILVPSQRVQKIALKHGFKKIHLADNASDKAMLRGLISVPGKEK